MTPKMKLVGGPELAKTLAGLSTRLSRSVKREALLSVAEPMRASMARRAPRGPDAPHVADNIVVSGGRGGVDEFGDEKAVSVAIGPARGFPNGFWQEFGTVHHGAQPFVRPAFDAEAPKVVQALVPTIWRELAGKGIQRPMQTGGGPITGGEGGSTL